MKLSGLIVVWIPLTGSCRRFHEGLKVQLSPALFELTLLACKRTAFCQHLVLDCALKYPDEVLFTRGALFPLYLWPVSARDCGWLYIVLDCGWLHVFLD